jgi:hypothetical protein
MTSTCQLDPFKVGAGRRPMLDCAGQEVPFRFEPGWWQGHDMWQRKCLDALACLVGR